MYKVPFVNYPVAYKKHKKEIDAAIQRCLNNGDYILRQDVTELENNIAQSVGTKYAVALNSGTDALFLSLKALGIGKGDEVITVAHTFVATIAAIVHCGATPVLVDIKDDYTMDEKLMLDAINRNTKAIVPVHLNGRMCNMDKIFQIAKYDGIDIIEDACQSLGASITGSLNSGKSGSWGDTGCFSFYPAKMLGCYGDGGIVTTHSKILADKIRSLGDHCQDRIKGTIDDYGYNSRLDNIQAAILNVKFKYLNDDIKRRRQIAGIYNQELIKLTGLDHIKLPPFSGKDVFNNYVIRVLEIYRDSMKNHLAKNGIETLISWPISLTSHQQLHLDFNLPKTEQFAKEVLSLPIYPELEDKQVKYVCDKIREFINV